MSKNEKYNLPFPNHFPIDAHHTTNLEYYIRLKHHCHPLPHCSFHAKFKLIWPEFVVFATPFAKQEGFLWIAFFAAFFEAAWSSNHRRRWRRRLPALFGLVGGRGGSFVSKGSTPATYFAGLLSQDPFWQISCGPKGRPLFQKRIYIGKACWEELYALQENGSKIKTCARSKKNLTKQIVSCFK